MGLFARITCLRHDRTAMDSAPTVRDLLRSRNVVETPGPPLQSGIAPAGDSWIMVFDHVEDPSAAISDADGMLAELGRTFGALALDIIVADGDDLVFLLTKASEQGGIVRPLSFSAMKEPTHRALHPFGQIPTHEEGGLALFESGTAVFHIAERHAGPAARRCECPGSRCHIAALSTMEPPIVDSEWLDGAFSAGDLLMVEVLRRWSGSGILDEYPNLAAHVARGEARPAFKRAFDAQLAVFIGVSNG